MTGFVTLSDELLTQLAADSCPTGRAAASPGDVVTPGSVLTLTGLPALLPKMTPWASFPHRPQAHTHDNIIYTNSVLTQNATAAIFAAHV